MEKKRILVLCDDVWHPAEVIERGIEALPTDQYQFEFQRSVKDLLLPEDLWNYDTVMITKCNQISAMNKEPWFEESVTETGPEEFRAYVEAGGSLLIVHSGACYHEEVAADLAPRFAIPQEKMAKLVGCKFLGHPLRSPMTVIPIANHPVTQGVHAFCERDEHYQLHMLDDAYLPLLRTESKEGKAQNGAYVRKFGLGNILVLLPGHTLAMWKHPEFQKLMLNALDWLCKENAENRKPVYAEGLIPTAGTVEDGIPSCRGNANAEKTVFITGADRGIGFALSKEFLNHGYHVFAGQFLTRWKELEQLQEEYPSRLTLIPLDVSETVSVQKAAARTAELTDHLDLLCNVAGIFQADGTEQNMTMFKVNAIGPICMTQAFLPLLRKGQRRLCYISSEAGSISLAHRVDTYGYGMSKAALNMAVRMMFQKLRPEGFTFRLYHPGWVRSYMSGDTISTEGIYSAEETAKVAFRSFTGPADCEDVLVMTDVEQETWSF